MSDRWEVLNSQNSIDTIRAFYRQSWRYMDAYK